MKKEVVLLLLLFCASVSAACVAPSDGEAITVSATFCSATFDLPSGISITRSNVVLDCGTAVLRGSSGKSDTGITVEDVDNVTIRNCNIVTYDQGLFLRNVTSSLIERNAFLKNRIGVRLFQAYENTLRDNSDKSLQLAVSAITSKFNVVMLGNKAIDRVFCSVNSCNVEKSMDPCMSGDFYCSAKCDASTDADCSKPIVAQDVPQIEQAPPVASAPQPVSPISAQVALDETPKPAPKAVSLVLGAGIFALFIAGIILVRKH